MFFSYLLISSVLLCVGYLTYKWIAANERQHRINRATIYLIYLAALILPIPLLLNIGWTNLAPGYPIVEFGLPTGGIIAPEPAPTTVINWMKVIGLSILIVYFTGVLVVTLRTIYGLIQLLKLIREGKRIKEKNYTLILTNHKEIAPFSWIKYIVMQEEDYRQYGNLILLHERSHLKLHHWIDLLVAQLMIIFQWFNPAAWLLREEFRTVHEYQADEAVLIQGTDIKSYQTMLIKKAVGTRFQSLANSLNHSKLKKRVTMMYKEKTSGVRRFSAIALVPAMLAGCALFEIPAVARVVDAASEISADLFGSKINQTQENLKEDSRKISEIYESVEDSPMESPSEIDRMSDDTSSASIEDSPVPSEVASDNSMPSDSEVSLPEETSASKSKEVYTAVEYNAEFPGGMAGMMKYLSQAIKYPEEAVAANEQGRVIVKFIVGKDGKVSDAQIVKGVSPSLDAEALRVVSSMPKWKPAEVNGEKVASWFTIPVAFKLTTDIIEVAE